MKFKKILGSLLSAAIIISISTVSTFALEVERIAGVDRYDTALKSNQKCYNKSSGSLAVLASGSDFKTALYGSYMANALKVPFYITPSVGLKTSVYDDMIRTGVERVYLMGSTRQTSKSIENYLISKGIKVTRFNNDDNFEGEIDSAIYQTFFYGQPRGDASVGLILNSKSFPDILSSIPFISNLAREQALYVADSNTFANPEYTKEGFRYIIGGYNTVPSNFRTFSGDRSFGLNYNQWSEDSPVFTTGRIAGENRYQTAIEIAKAYEIEVNDSFDTVMLIDGTNYPDALSSGVVATKNNTVVLLTQPKSLNKDTKEYIVSNGIKKVIIVGGENSVSKAVENELKAIN